MRTYIWVSKYSQIYNDTRFAKQWDIELYGTLVCLQLETSENRYINFSSTEMSTNNLPGGEGRSARNVENLAAICEPIV
jgi:hypothetical protein